MKERLRTALGMLLFGAVWTAGSLACARYVEFHGQTWAGFYFGAFVGVAMMAFGIAVAFGYQMND